MKLCNPVFHTKRQMSFWLSWCELIKRSDFKTSKKKMGENMETVRKYYGLNVEAMSLLLSSLLSSGPVVAWFNTDKSSITQRTHRNIHVFMAHSDI